MIFQQINEVANYKSAFFYTVKERMMGNGECIKMRKSNCSA